MCYKAKLTDEGSIARVAEKDIPVIKYLNKTEDGFRAPIYEKYSYNNTNHTSELDIRILKTTKEILIDAGLHSLSAEVWGPSNCLATAIVPKGSVYYTNGEECVSSNLVMIEAYRNTNHIKKFIISYHINGNKSLINRIKNYFLRIHKWT